MIVVTIAHGMRGWFAVLVGDDGPIQTSHFSYSDKFGASCDARDWATAEDIPLGQTPRRILEKEGLL